MENKVHCFRCSQPDANVKKGMDWYHQKCWDNMPANGVFPKEFRRLTAQEQLDRALKSKIKNNQLVL